MTVSGYLTTLNDRNGDSRHMFVRSMRDSLTGAWKVLTATGDAVAGGGFVEKVYEGSTRGAFINERNADAYAAKVIANKQTEGWTLAWSLLDDEQIDAPAGGIPTWFRDHFKPAHSAAAIVAAVTTIAKAARTKRVAKMGLKSAATTAATNNEEQDDEQAEAEVEPQHPFYSWQPRQD